MKRRNLVIWMTLDICVKGSHWRYRKVAIASAYCIKPEIYDFALPVESIRLLGATIHTANSYPYLPVSSVGARAQDIHARI